MGRPKKWGIFTVQKTVSDAFDNAVSELTCLRDEITEWKDGMEGTGLENTYKYEMLDEAEQFLEGVDELEGIGLDGIELMDDLLQTEISVHEIRKKRLARHHRLSNSINELQAVVEMVEGVIELTNDNINDDIHNVDLSKDEIEKLEDQVDDLEQIKTQIEDAVNEFENIEFPGMYS